MKFMKMQGDTQKIMTKGWVAAVMDEQLSPRLRFMLIAFVTGLLSGVAAYLLKAMIGVVSHLFVNHFDSQHSNWALIVLPVAGIVLAALFQLYVARREIYHGVDRLNNALASGRYSLPAQLTFTPMIAATLTLGFGGSAGSEGPVAYTGSAIGSNVGRVFGLGAAELKAMVACGAAAGIAGIFKAPIGGAFFALECLTVELASTSIIALMIASVTAGLTAFVLSGCTPDIYFSDALTFDMHWLPLVAVFGLFAGLYSIYYQTVMTRLSAWYGKLRNHWVKNLTAGLITGVAVFLFPPLFGEGYGFISKLLAGDSGAMIPYGIFAGHTGSLLLFSLLAAGMILVKAFATASATSGGGVAGDFAPSLFAGCVAGFLFALLVNAWGVGLPHPGGVTAPLPVGYFAFFGMGAVMAATQRAPLMAIFLTIEMGSAYTLFLPMTIAATISYFTLRLLGRRLGLKTAAPRS